MRWVKLGAICLFLGGGVPSAVLNWPLGILPPDVSFRAILDHAGNLMAAHEWLFVPVVLMGLAIGLALFYVRSIGRFVLVDSILRGDVRIRHAWVSNRRLGRSYFGWLVSVLIAMGGVFSLAALALFPLLQSWAAAKATWFPMVVAGLLAMIGIAGVLLALAITLTDDFVVPTMYAERIALPRAWKGLVLRMTGEPATFGLYILVRIGLAVVAGAAVLLLLFPMALAILSGALVTKALAAFVIGALGFTWEWNAATITLGFTAFGLVTVMLFAALSMAQMPAQVFTQDFAIEFISSSVPSLAALLNPAADDDQPADHSLTA